MRFYRNNKLEQVTIERADSVRWATVDLLTPLHAVVEAADGLRRGVDGELSAAQQNSLTLLGLRPDRSHVRCILVLDDDLETIDRI